jgi:hypothetical protein
MINISNYLRNVLDVAEHVGRVEEVHMGDWLQDSKRIDISGKTHDGEEFTLCLEIHKEVSEDVV